VAYCHSKHVIHLDIKPDNILFRRNYALEVVLANFGMSVVITSKSNEFDGRSWPPDPVDYADDLWSVGIVFEEMLAREQEIHIFPGTIPDPTPEEEEDLLLSLLTLDKAERITAANALNHPYFKRVRSTD
jgi:serine/threonine protein kinase